MYNCAVASQSSYWTDSQSFIQDQRSRGNKHTLVYAKRGRDRDGSILPWAICASSPLVDRFPATQIQPGVPEPRRTWYISFRGTQLDRDMEDIFCNANAFLEFWNPRDPSKGSVHRGFKNNAIKYYLEGVLSTFVLKLLTESNDYVVFTGHSLGGATAVLATLLVHESEKWLTTGRLRCITFGVPPVGNVYFAQYLKRLGETFLRMDSWGFDETVGPTQQHLIELLPFIAINHSSDIVPRLSAVLTSNLLFAADAEAVENKVKNLFSVSASSSASSSSSSSSSSTSSSIVSSSLSSSSNSRFFSDGLQLLSESLTDLSDHLVKTALEGASSIVGNEIRKVQSTYYVASGAIIELQGDGYNASTGSEDLQPPVPRLVWCSCERVGNLLKDSNDRGSIDLPTWVSDGVQSHSIGSSYVASLNRIFSHQLNVAASVALALASTSTSTSTSTSEVSNSAMESLEFEPDLWENLSVVHEEIEEVLHI